MPVETIEITLIFLIMFIFSASVILLFQSITDPHKILDYFYPYAKNNVFLCYSIVYSLKNSTLFCKPSYTFETKVVAVQNGLEVSSSRFYYIINVNNVSGFAIGDFYLYNDNQTIYIT